MKHISVRKRGFIHIHNLICFYRNFCDFTHYCNGVWDFFLKLQIISILYALIKYNKIGSTFRKIYAQQIKQNKISTNSFLVMEKKGNVFVALKILQLCSTETQKKNKKEKKSIYKSNDPRSVYFKMTFL